MFSYENKLCSFIRRKVNVFLSENNHSQTLTFIVLYLFIYFIFTVTNVFYFLFHPSSINQWIFNISVILDIAVIAK